MQGGHADGRGMARCYRHTEGRGTYTIVGAGGQMWGGASWKSEAPLHFLSDYLLNVTHLR